MMKCADGELTDKWEAGKASKSAADTPTQVKNKCKKWEALLRTDRFKSMGRLKL